MRIGEGLKTREDLLAGGERMVNETGAVAYGTHDRGGVRGGRVAG